MLGEDVEHAVLLLQSLGAHNLCRNQHGYVLDPSWDTFLPLCQHHEGALTENVLHNLRGNSARELTERAFGSIYEEERYYAVNVLGVFICVFGVALIAGLFLGLLTLDVQQLRIILRASRDDNEKLYASTIIPILEERHRLLVTLLLINALAYEAMPIFLDALVPSWCAILLSTTFIMFFGEVLPSGIFTGPHQLYLGYKLAPLTRCFLWIMYPFAKPLAMVMDRLVEGGNGGSDDSYTRGELSALVRIQYEDSGSTGIQNKRFPTPQRDDTWHATKQEIIEKANELDDEQGDQVEQLDPPLHRAEVDLIEGALQMKTAVVMDVYTPLSHLYAISDELVLDRKGFTEIYRLGYSRVPVYRNQPSDPEDKTAILGFLMVRQLMLIDWDHERDVSTLPLQQPNCVSPRMNLVDALRVLRSHGYLMAFVCARPDLANRALLALKPIPVEAGFLGIVTLEDVMESLLQDRIYDEWDIRDRDRAVGILQRWAATKLQEFARRKAKARREYRRSRSSHAENDEDETTSFLRDGNPPGKRYQSV